ncbi:hypothetical protein BDY24DRAFT_402347 [Mrakia frigida]|uniref:uncharacterized protein n=1 Tax=Mrakia frigida TaxID=29902 RepID=UPI003FCC1924
MSFKGPKRKRGLKSHLQDGRKVYDISDSDDDEPMAPMDQSPLAGPSNHNQGKEVIDISDSDEDLAPSSAASVPSISTPKASQSSTLHGSQPRYQRFHPRTPSPSVVPETPPLSDDDDEPPVRLDKGKGRAEPRLSTESRGVFSRSIIEVDTDDEEEQDQEDETEREDEETVSPRVLRVRKKTKGKPLDVAGLVKNLPREDVKRVVAVLTKAKEESKRTSKRARTSSLELLFSSTIIYSSFVVSPLTSQLLLLSRLVGTLDFSLRII